MKQSENAAVNLFGIGYISNDGQIMNSSGEQMNLNELKEIAQKQQKQIELQQNILVSKEQKLKFLKQQLSQSKTITNENDRLQKLRMIVEAQEGKLLKVQALKEKLEQKISENSFLSREVDSLRDEYHNKQNTYSILLSQVQELTGRLDELRRWKVSNDLKTKDSENSYDYKLEKIRNDVIALNQVHSDHQKSLKAKKQYLSSRVEDVAVLNRQIEELANRLEQKKLNSSSVPNDKKIFKSSSAGALPRMHTNVAAVEPLVKQTNPFISVPPSKNANDSYNQASTSQSSYAISTVGRNLLEKSSEVPLQSNLRKQANGAIPSFGRQRALSSFLDNHSSYAKAQENRDFYNKSMPPSANKEQRPDSAAGQLYSDSSSQRQDSFTAKVHPLIPSPNLQQSNSKSLPSSFPQQQSQTSVGNYYPLSTKSRSLDSPVTSTSDKNLTYKRPTDVRATHTKDTNIDLNASVLKSTSQSSSHVHSPPPYPTSIKKTTPVVVHPANSLDQSPESRDSFAEERSFSVDIEALRRKFAHAPRPLKKRSSLSEADRTQRPVVPKIAYDKLYKKADIPFHRSLLEPNQRSTPPPAYDDSNHVISPPFNSNQMTYQPESLGSPIDTVSYEKNLTPKEFLKQQNQSAARFKPTKSNIASPPPYELKHSVVGEPVPESPLSSQPSLSSLSATPTKGILKLPSGKKKPSRRIRFDPFALLLDASLEGDFDLVQRVVSQVPDPSQSNDEGITALHNAVCACHFDLVKFLVHYGSDVNAADADGWTPLHCSASCNNLPMSRFLVENGACVFATTLSDSETAADKCEELDEGYLPCYEYLHGVQEKLGVARQGQVYALFDYVAENDDELSFQDGDLMTILRRGDNKESEWWWARIGEREGYIPRNLIGLWPRIKSNK